MKAKNFRHSYPDLEVRDGNVYIVGTNINAQSAYRMWRLARHTSLSFDRLSQVVSFFSESEIWKEEKLLIGQI